MKVHSVRYADHHQIAYESLLYASGSQNSDVSVTGGIDCLWHIDFVRHDCRTYGLLAAPR